MQPSLFELLQQVLVMIHFFTYFRRLPKSHYTLHFMLVIGLILTLIVTRIAYFQVSANLASQATQRLNEFASKIEIELDKYRALPKVLMLHPLIEQTLTQPIPANIDNTNQLLQHYNSSLSSDVIYLIAPDGITLASSNWQSNDSFVGSNYQFRPYFQQAIAGSPGGYFALGTVSGTRGYYFSYPVIIEQEVKGVLVIKVALSALESNWPKSELEFLLTDKHGVIFYSSSQDWNYQALPQLTPTVAEQLLNQRQYGDKPLRSMTQSDSLQAVLAMSHLTLKQGHNNPTFIQVNRDMSATGWRLIALTPISTVYRTISWIALSFTVFYLLIVMIGFSWRRTVDARKELAAINAKLEHRVEERTAELSESNEQLRNIIEKYKQTEQTLKSTQNELIQAGKLALLGEMAASINHELNQPLAAMRIYTETLQTLAKRNDIEAIISNAQEILKLNKMMAKIISQYKLFARKSAGKSGPVSLAETISASLAILDSKLVKLGVHIETSTIPDNLQVMADAVPLEQVIINLLNNALQAISLIPQPQIQVLLKIESDKVMLTITDNGPGFDKQQLERLFEPFYTTKGQGLGLGLTISKRIIESFHGTIVAHSQPTGGAQFVVILPRYTLEKLS